MFQSLQTLARTIAVHNSDSLKMRPQFHWDSWYEAYHDFNYRKLTEVLDGLKRVTPAIPFRNVMIDECWCPPGD